MPIKIRTEGTQCFCSPNIVLLLRRTNYVATTRNRMLNYVDSWSDLTKLFLGSTSMKQFGLRKSVDCLKTTGGYCSPGPSVESFVKHLLRTLTIWFPLYISQLFSFTDFQLNWLWFRIKYLAFIFCLPWFESTWLTVLEVRNVLIYMQVTPAICPINCF